MGIWCFFLMLKLLPFNIGQGIEAYAIHCLQGQTSRVMFGVSFLFSY